MTTLPTVASGVTIRPMTDNRTIHGILPAYPDREPWCSRCGSPFGDHDGFRWVEPQQFEPLTETQPHYPDASGFFAALCDDCTADQLPPAPIERYKTAQCSDCAAQIELPDCLWFDFSLFAPPDGEGSLFFDRTGKLFSICPTCYQEHVDHFLELDD